MAHIRFFAGAAEAAGVDRAHLPAASVGELRTAIVETLGARIAEVLPRCTVLIDGVAMNAETPADAPIAPDAEVDVLPPFAGG